MDSLRISLSQLNPVMGDIDFNVSLALSAHRDAIGLGSDLIVFSELFVSGYPPEDLVLKPSFIDSCRLAIDDLCRATLGVDTSILIGCPWRGESGELYNSALLLGDGEILSIRHKVDLPNYGVFDEKRTFSSGCLSGPMNFRGVRLGVAICEDIWGDSDICETLSESGCDIILVLNGSPYFRDVLDIRYQVVLRQVISSGLPIAYINQVGGQDELVFDGGSFIFNSDKELIVQLPRFESCTEITDWRRTDSGWRCVSSVRPASSVSSASDWNDWRASVLGLRDYVGKNGFSRVVLGLSGGIDSAVCAAMCVDALGASNVLCLLLPSPYTSPDSISDAIECATLLGVDYETIDISAHMDSFTLSLSSLLESSTDDEITLENLQSRIRGVILMAYSNRLGSLLVTTGNKSELSVGYATLYGDMNGGFNPLKDFYKTEVFSLARWRNGESVVIPQSIIDKPPSAELRANQKDSDSLPDYDTLDLILRCLIESDQSVDDIVSTHNLDRDLVIRIEHLLYVSEYKRRQSPPGIKITSRSFGRERRYPITNCFRHLLSDD